jgi:hypothetical protein
MKRALVMLVIVVLSLPMVSYGNLSGFGKATIDGVLSPGEWDNAAKVDFQANLPSSDGGGTAHATLYVMNDDLNLYLAVKVDRPSGYLNYFVSDFSNKNKGVPADGDDRLQVYVGPSISLMFSDMYRYTCPGALAGSAACMTEDNDSTEGILPAGTTDGGAAANINGSVTIMEISHLLNSTDTLHDFSLKPGDTVGLIATLRLFSINTSSFTFADTVIPVPGSALVSGAGSSYGQITIASATRPIDVNIDIKPGSRENSINRKSEGKIPVAILSTREFNAPARVDRTSLTFGRTGDEQSLAFCNEGSEDVNGDGLPDLVCHFSTQLAGFQSVKDTIGVLKGKTIDTDEKFTAQDSVRIVK